MIEVTASIIEIDGRFLAARRAPGQHLAGFWELPGGKIESGESAEECLARELAEEFGVEVEVGDRLGESVHDYGDKKIRLIGFNTRHISGEFKPIDHDEIRWLTATELESVEWAPADIPLVKLLTRQITAAKTNSFYQKSAKDYCEETLAFDMSDAYKRFLDMVSPGGKILDLGCGSGRDSRYFLNQGYDVSAIDASSEIAKLASEYIGKSVKVQSFYNLDDLEQYDGVWACACLLHCPKADMTTVLSQVAAALKPGGVLYMSFKRGEGERTDEFGRFMNNYLEPELTELIGSLLNVAEFEVWSDVTTLRGADQTWVNALAMKAR